MTAPSVSTRRLATRQPKAQLKESSHRRGDVIWHRRWTWDGEPDPARRNAGRYVWTSACGRLSAWCESREFRTEPNGEQRLHAIYRGALDGRTSERAFDTLHQAMDAADAARVRADYEARESQRERLAG